MTLATSLLTAGFVLLCVGRGGSGPPGDDVEADIHLMAGLLIAAALAWLARTTADVWVPEIVRGPQVIVGITMLPIAVVVGIWRLSDHGLVWRVLSLSPAAAGAMGIDLSAARRTALMTGLIALAVGGTAAGLTPVPPMAAPELIALLAALAAGRERLEIAMLLGAGCGALGPVLDELVAPSLATAAPFALLLALLVTLPPLRRTAHG